MKYFSVDEAQRLIPKLEEIFGTVQEIAAKAQEKAGIIGRLRKNENKNISELAIERAQVQFLTNEMNDWLQRIVDLGAMPKGLEPALVDFPHLLDGQEVFLCWKLGERTITHYHGLDEGFSGRKALPETLH